MANGIASIAYRMMLEVRGDGLAASERAGGESGHISTVCRLLQFLDEGGDDFEEVADDAVVSHFKDGSVLVLVDCGDGARAFHADHVLDCSADSEREIKFGCDGLSRAADLAVHGEPAFVANGARGANFSADEFGEFFDHGDIFRSFDAAADRNQNGSLCEVDGLFRFAEKLQRLCSDLFRLQINGDGFYRSFAAGVLCGKVGAECAGLKSCDPGSVAGEYDVSVGAALKHLADED